MLKAILCGNYVNLGVFKLYGDNAFDSVMNTAAKLILSIPHKDLLVSHQNWRLLCNILFAFHFQEYPKLSTAYYILLECLAQDHIKFLSTLEPTVFLYILESISEGLNALGECSSSRNIMKLNNELFWQIFFNTLFRLDDYFRMLCYIGQHSLLYIQAEKWASTARFACINI